MQTLGVTVCRSFFEQEEVRAEGRALFAPDGSRRATIAYGRVVA
jgi:hypothetical protein